jgi:hypothetical protein
MLSLRAERSNLDEIAASPCGLLAMTGLSSLCSESTTWLVPGGERLAAERHPREFDRLGDDLKPIERDRARSALADDRVKRAMTISCAIRWGRAR